MTELGTLSNIISSDKYCLRGFVWRRVNLPNFLDKLSIKKLGNPTDTFFSQGEWKPEGDAEKNVDSATYNCLYKKTK